MRLEDLRFTGPEAAEFLAEHTPVWIDGRSVNGTLDRVHFIKRTLRTSGVVEPGADIGIHTALIGAIYIYPIESLPQQVTMGWDLFNDRISRVPAVTSDEAGGLPTTVEPDDPTLVWKNFLTNPSQPAFMEVQAPPEPRRVAIPVISVACLGMIAVVWIRRFLKASTSLTRQGQPLAVSMVLIAVAILTIRWPTWTVTMPGSRSRQLAASDAAAVTHSLLHNVYRAFDYRDESTVYDVLDRSVSGELLTRTYLDTQESLTLASQGGASARVKEVELLELDAEPAPDRAIRARVAWQVRAAVGHWGHIHQRRNQYVAELKIEPVDGGELVRHLPINRGGMSSAFMNLNRGKRSIALDVNVEAGRDIVLDLIAEADVVVQNFRPGVVDRILDQPVSTPEAI